MKLVILISYTLIQSDSNQFRAVMRFKTLRRIMSIKKVKDFGISNADSGFLSV
jgi:hypothetical protein